jgi:hypothetical protein
LIPAIGPKKHSRKVFKPSFFIFIRAVRPQGRSRGKEFTEIKARAPRLQSQQFIFLRKNLLMPRKGWRYLGGTKFLIKKYLREEARNVVLFGKKKRRIS